ncbi:ABC transporter ATP-binding protein [Salinibacterium sp. ZJ450]|uniref:ABC transporter ATP-binding protein n=1 Tax=Salinibacterium sp. ZJ450 TaxID=2708338 RepID=UPI0014233EF3|nr:ABC transporter ATP-binding protein [Salinibacterium sp. ZJ450]
MTVVSVRGVTKRYRGTVILDDVSFDLDQGKTYGLVGANGSGKSVLLKLLCGFTVPDAGEIWIDPRYLSKNRSFPDRFGVTINGPAYLPGSTARQNLLDLAAIQKRISPDDVDAALRRIGLRPELKQKVRSYSLGMKQKLSLAQALMENPEVLLLDEPFNALDADSVRILRGILREEQAKGTTIVFTSHNREDIDELSTEILEINAGRITRRLTGSSPFAA